MERVLKSDHFARRNVVDLHKAFADLHAALVKQIHRENGHGDFLVSKVLRGALRACQCTKAFCLAL